MSLLVAILIYLLGLLGFVLIMWLCSKFMKDKDDADKENNHNLPSEK